jgi:adenosylcobinamide amidohydrolase
MQEMAGRILTIATSLVALAMASSALADEQTKRDAFAAVGVIEAADLDGVRGREGGQNIIVATDQELTASVVGGSITAHEVTTGGVTFGERALDGFGGIGVFNVVTGNNNSVQAAIGVTFNLLE